MNLVNRHVGETIVPWGNRTMGGDVSEVVQAHIKNGVITAFEPDESINPGIAHEDDNWNAVLSGSLKARVPGRVYAMRKTVYSPNRLLYPMVRVSGSPRGQINGQFVRTSWDNALTAISTQMQSITTKYGPNSIYYNHCQARYPNGATGWG